MTFERMTGVHAGTIGKNDWYFREIEQIYPNSLIREITMAGNERDLVNFIGTHMQDLLRAGEPGTRVTMVGISRHQKHGYV